MLAAIVSLLLIQMGCKKKHLDPIPTPQTPNQPNNEISCSQNKIYFPLTKGSYWIYEENNYDSTTNFRGFRSLDSCLVLEKDSIVNGKRYAVMATYTTNPYGIHSLYYSLYHYEGDYVHSLTNQDYKIFSYCKTGDILYTNTAETPLWSSEFKILSKDSNVNVPAGTFETRSTENKYTRTMIDENDPDDLYRVNSTYYGKNIGLVYSLCPYTGNKNQFVERRLLRYTIGQ